MTTIKALQLTLLPISFEHVLQVSTLPQLKSHRDPFDRMLIAQAQVENLSIVSKDPAFESYGIERIW